MVCHVGICTVEKGKSCFMAALKKRAQTAQEMREHSVARRFVQ